MTTFKNFSDAVSKNILTHVKNRRVFAYVDLDNETIWDTYLSAFPEEHNQVFRVNRAYDCTEDRKFVQVYGNVVVINDDGSHTSVWDIEVGSYYKQVAAALKNKAENAELVSVFTYNEKSVGRVDNVDTYDTSIVWSHFYLQTPTYFMDLGADKAAKVKEGADMFVRACNTFTLDAITDLLSLIASGSVYRGESFRAGVSALKDMVIAYNEAPEANKYGIAILSAVKQPTVVRLRNTAIGTLLEDMSVGDTVNNLDAMLESYGKKVDPVNYRRPTAQASTMTISKAKQKLEELGLMNALSRRNATEADIDLNNTIFRSRPEANLDVFADMSADVKGKPKKLELAKAIEISFDKFVTDVLPTLTEMELLFEPRLRSNLVTLTTEAVPGSGNLFNWDNTFAWTYNGDVTDAITERVKARGGNTDGPLRISLLWHNGDDLDLHVKVPNGKEIYFGNRCCSLTGGTLDIDENRTMNNDVDPVENVVFPDINRLREGSYTVSVDNWNKRHNVRQGFTVQVAFDGKLMNYTYPNSSVSDTPILSVTYTKGKFSVEKVNSKVTQTDVSLEQTKCWNITTNTFVPVSFVMNSPNHWEGDKGHKHTLFMLKDCRPDSAVRGIFNEYLRPELHEHRKVFETLGEYTKIEPSQDALAGIGFSSKKDSFTVRTTGRMLRTYNVTL